MSIDRLAELPEVWPIDKELRLEEYRRVIDLGYQAFINRFGHLITTNWRPEESTIRICESYPDLVRELACLPNKSGYQSDLKEHSLYGLAPQGVSYVILNSFTIPSTFMLSLAAAHETIHRLGSIENPNPSLHGDADEFITQYCTEEAFGVNDMPFDQVPEDLKYGHAAKLVFRQLLPVLGDSRESVDNILRLVFGKLRPNHIVDATKPPSFRYIDPLITVAAALNKGYIISHYFDELIEEAAKNAGTSKYAILWTEPVSTALEYTKQQS